MNCKRVPPLQGPLKRGCGGGGNEEGAEGRGKDERQEEGDESARLKGARVFGTRLHPSSSRRRGGARPLGRLASSRGRGKGLKRQRPPRGPASPTGRVSGGCSALADWGVAATAARPVGRRGLWGPPRFPPAGFYAPTAGEGSSGVMPARRRTAARVT